MYRISTPKSYQAYYYADSDCTTDVPPVPSKLEVAHRYQTQLQRKKQEEEGNEGPVSLSALSVAAIPEADSLAWGSVHKMWSMIRIDAPDRTKMGKTTTYVDFVVVIDHSASMKTNNKLAFVQATIEYLISKLDETHRFCLIQFNQEVSLVTEGLLPMSTENKETVRALLHEIRPQGTTNISDALFTAVGILSNRVPEEQSRISSIMLFTDGLSNVGLRGRNFMDAMKDMVIPPGLTINTFGYGLDHDSKMLQNISFSSKGGVYYYIENVKTIPATFGECLAGILSTVAHNIEVRLIANDGCRIVNFYTKFPIKELKSVKEYGVSMGSMYSQESRTLLFKLSLRKMEQELSKQPLVQVVVSYTNTLTGVDQIAHASVIIGRPKVAPEPKIPVELDKQINRYTAAAAIEEAIKKASTRDFFGAQKQLKEVIEIVQSSASAKDPASRVYCEDLVEDLKECAVGMEDMESFSSGIHYAHSYSTMYYMERSTGSSNLMGVKKSVETTQLQQQQQIMLQEVEYNHSQKRSRNHGYGYVTYEQGEEASRAVEQTAIFVPGYLDNAL